MFMIQDHDIEIQRFSIGLVVFGIIALLAHVAGTCRSNTVAGRTRVERIATRLPPELALAQRREVVIVASYPNSTGS